MNGEDHTEEARAGVTVLRRLMQLAGPAPGDPRLEQAAMHLRDALHTLGCHRKDPQVAHSSATTALFILHYLNEMCSSKPDAFDAASLGRAVQGYAAVVLGALGAQVVRVDPDVPVEEQGHMLLEQMIAADELEQDGARMADDATDRMLADPMMFILGKLKELASTHTFPDGMHTDIGKARRIMQAAGCDISDPHVVFAAAAICYLILDGLSAHGRRGPIDQDALARIASGYATAVLGILGVENG